MMIKQVVTTLKMTPVVEAVSVPFVAQFVGDEGEIVPNEVMESAADGMLIEIGRYSEALHPL